MLTNSKFPKERLGKITGSQCGCMFPKRGDGMRGMRSYAKKLANELYFEYYDEISSWQTEHGESSEGMALEHYQAHYHPDAVKGEFISIKDCGGSPDAVCCDYGIDFKCPTTLGKWLDYHHEPMDETHYNQCQMYMYLTGREYWWIAAYLTETEKMFKEDVDYPVPADKRMIVTRVNVSKEWQAILKENTPKVIKMRDEFLLSLQEHFRIEKKKPKEQKGREFTAEDFFNI